MVNGINIWLIMVNINGYYMVNNKYWLVVFDLPL